MRLGDGLSNGKLRKVQDTKASSRHSCNRFDPVEGFAVLFGKLRQAAKLGKRVGEVGAVRIDDGDIYCFVAVKKRKSGHIRRHSSRSFR